MLSRLIYASECTEAFDAREVDALLKTCRRNNSLRDLTGMLAFDSRCFLQALEGDREVLTTLLGRLMADPRHRRVVVMGFEAVDRRRFADWAMAFAAADATRKSAFLRHGPSSRFEPYRMHPSAALDLLVELGSTPTAALAPAA